jgi:hypothetical protein
VGWIWWWGSQAICLAQLSLWPPWWSPLWSLLWSPALRGGIIGLLPVVLLDLVSIVVCVGLAWLGGGGWRMKEDGLVCRVAWCAGGVVCWRREGFESVFGLVGLFWWGAGCGSLLRYAVLGPLQGV